MFFCLVLQAVFLTVALAHGTHTGSAHTHHHGSAHTHHHKAGIDHTFPSSFSSNASGPAPMAAVRFPLSAITLDPTSNLYLSQARNANYMLTLDNARLLCLFTSAANLTGTFSNPTCRAYDHPQYFGHYFGHYLSAMAIYIENQGNATPTGAAMQGKLDDLLTTIEAVVAAWAGVGEVGFFYPYSPTSFATLEAGRNCDPVCVPYYVFHKSLAGFIDLAVRTGNGRALALAKGMGDWASARVAHVLATGGQPQWQMVLGTEWGGMNHALYNLYALTGTPAYLTTAYFFNHFDWTSPLVVHFDRLQDFHANTHLPEILGDLTGYQLTSNATQLAIVDNFLDMLLVNHSWATGGSNDGEYWQVARTMLQQLNSDTEETCTQYNIIKITSTMGDVTGDSLWYDWAEKQLWNGMLGNQNLGGEWEGMNTTGFHYMLPLGGSPLKKPWGDSATGFPCCWGTSTEQFAGRHLELAFTHSPDHTTLFANLFMPVTLVWEGRGGMKVQADSGFPASLDFTTRLTFTQVPQTQGEANFTLALRIPRWTSGGEGGIIITLNGAPLPPSTTTTPTTPTPGSYFFITRAWEEGDVLSAYFPATLWWEQITDDSPQAQSIGALHYGGILLAGVNNTENTIPGKDTSAPSGWVSRVAGADPDKLYFTMEGPFGYCGGGGGGGNNITLQALGDIKDEGYTVYWNAGALPTPIGPTTPTFTLTSGPEEWSMWGGAGFEGGGDVLRSGNPGEVNTALLKPTFMDASGAKGIVGVDFTYQFNVGYGPAGRERGSNFTVAIVEACFPDQLHPKVLGVLYTSKDLTSPAYDTCSSCYSTPVVVHVALPTPIQVSQLAQVAFIFQDNDRNLNMPVGFNVTLTWQ